MGVARHRVWLRWRRPRRTNENMRGERHVYSFIFEGRNHEGKLSQFLLSVTRVLKQPVRPVPRLD